jgi:P-type Cu2+ transporter
MAVEETVDHEPLGLTLRPEIAAISMSGSSVLVAVNALALKRLRLS